MPLTDLVAPNAIIPALKVNGKKQAIQELSARAAKLTGQSERLIFETLMQREKLGSTGVGNGIAIPHGKLPKLEKLVGLFARLERAIDFEVARRPAGRSDFPAARPGRRGRRSSQGARARRAAVARGRGGDAAARDARCRRALRGAGAAVVGSGVDACASADELDPAIQLTAATWRASNGRARKTRTRGRIAMLVSSQLTVACARVGARASLGPAHAQYPEPSRHHHGAARGRQRHGRAGAALCRQAVARASASR